MGEIEDREMPMDEQMDIFFTHLNCRDVGKVLFETKDLITLTYLIKEYKNSLSKKYKTPAPMKEKL